MARESSVAERIAAVRRFNRFYTQKIGVLDEGLLNSSFSLTEVRVLYELAHRNAPTATEVVRDLGLDAGYMSRIVRRLEQLGLVERQASQEDGRRNILRLTERGLQEFGAVNASTNEQIGGILATLSRAQQDRLLNALRLVEKLLNGVSTAAGTARRRRRAAAGRASSRK
jgi:DNA-binding MarR family transcriptional regulator